MRSLLHLLWPSLAHRYAEFDNNGSFSLRLSVTTAETNFSISNSPFHAKEMGGNGQSGPIGLKWRSNTLFVCCTVGIGAFTDLFLYELIGT